MNCIVIKKPEAENSLIEFIKKVPYFDLFGTYNSVFDAYKILQLHDIDVIFIDTDLPNISGIDFIRSLDIKAMFIFISEDKNLAIEGFNLNAIDFLVKPLSFERFLKAANKVLFYSNLMEKRTSREKKDENKQSDYVLVRSDYQTQLIKLDNILYVEGLKDYIKIYTLKHDKPIITLNSLKNFEENLPSNRFSRIHKSYIVGHEHIKSINKSQVFIQDKNIPIGESFRSIFFTKMEDLRI